MKISVFSLFWFGFIDRGSSFIHLMLSRQRTICHCSPQKEKENFSKRNYSISKRAIRQPPSEEMDEGIRMIEQILSKINETLLDDNKTHLQQRKFPILIKRLPKISIVSEDDDDQDNDNKKYDMFGRPYQDNTFEKTKSRKRSTHFEIVESTSISFQDVGGYENIKHELYQCVDILKNYTKYAQFNVRIPKGLVLEGPPGNGKTLLAKAFAGEADTSFIAVSGAEFQDKYVGVGASRIRELFELARDNVPCVIFIDEIDALGRKRSSDGEQSNSERDSTLNELLVALDGFKNISGVFVIGATNRADMLDDALMRPGRIDKRIFISNPDETTRRAILAIHSQGKPHDDSVIFDNLVEQSNGLSGAQIENLLNEAMLYALRDNRLQFNSDDVDKMLNKMLSGWQPTEHVLTANQLHQIAIHELGHAVVSLFCKHHSKMTKIIINLSSPKTPAYTVFENKDITLMSREALFERLIILFGGRIAEEVFFGVSVSTGASHDLEEINKIAHHMIIRYGMGERAIYPNSSEKYKEMIDNEIATLIQNSYQLGVQFVQSMKPLIAEGATLLEETKLVTYEKLVELSKGYCSIDA
jgi:cell division protease FtsH